MVVFPKCKINLGLNVIEKRIDGYHNIESVFYPINLCDVLEVIEDKTKKETISISISGIEIEGNVEDNLCYKAYHILQKNYDLPGIKLFLHKSIPTGAGLGGGSSDGAMTIVILNQLFNLEMSVIEMDNYALQLGSDCAFFIESEPCFVQGRGEDLLKINNILKDLFLVVINPGIHVKTSNAYSNLQPKKAENKIFDIVTKSPIDKWKDMLRNDFEPYVFEFHPAVKTIKEKLYAHGAIYSSMSGSGSSVYGIFEKETDLKNIFQNYFYWSGKM